MLQGISIGVGSVIHPPLVIGRVAPRQTFVPDKSRRHSEQMGQGDPDLFRRAQVSMLGKIGENRGVDIGNPTAIECDPDEKRCHALGDRLQVMLDGRIKGDGTERFSPPPVVAGEIVLVDHRPATGHNNGMGARLPPSLEMEPDSAKGPSRDKRAIWAMRIW